VIGLVIRLLIREQRRKGEGPPAGYWMASDGRWYPPSRAPGEPPAANHHGAATPPWTTSGTSPAGQLPPPPDPVHGPPISRLRLAVVLVLCAVLLVAYVAFFVAGNS
jgi:hypothetical protein